MNFDPKISILIEKFCFLIFIDSMLLSFSSTFAQILLSFFFNFSLNAQFLLSFCSAVAHSAQFLPNFCQVLIQILLSFAEFLLRVVFNENVRKVAFLKSKGSGNKRDRVWFFCSLVRFLNSPTMDVLEIMNLQLVENQASVYLGIYFSISNSLILIAGLFVQKAVYKLLKRLPSRAINKIIFPSMVSANPQRKFN